METKEIIPESGIPRRMMDPHLQLLHSHRKLPHLQFSNFLGWPLLGAAIMHKMCQTIVMERAMKMEEEVIILTDIIIMKGLVLWITILIPNMSWRIFLQRNFTMRLPLPGAFWMRPAHFLTNTMPHKEHLISMLLRRQRDFSVISKVKPPLQPRQMQQPLRSQVRCLPIATCHIFYRSNQASETNILCTVRQLKINYQSCTVFNLTIIYRYHCHIYDF